jgi:hypothetical protein
MESDCVNQKIYHDGEWFGFLVIGGELCRARRLQASQNVFSAVAAQTEQHIH